MINPDSIKILPGAIEGKSGIQISRETGIPQATVYRRLQNPELRIIIEQAQEEIIKKGTPQAVKNFIEMANSTSNDKQDRYLKYKVSKDILDGAGVLSNQPSIIVQQVFNQQNNYTLPPITQSILDKHLIDIATIDTFE